MTTPWKKQDFRIDANTETLMTIDYAHHEIHSGSHFYVAGCASIANGAALDFLWVTPNSTKYPHALWEIDAEVEMHMAMYEDVNTAANGTAVTVFNNNRNSVTAATVLAYQAASLASGALGDGSAGGNLVWSHVIGSGKKVGGEGGRGHEFIGKENTKYWFRIQNTSGSTGWLNYDFNWYEHTDRH